jgi:NAD(P)-dependent dehydrogenase (short-subunit alcohol dehydrogenase family)
MSDNYAAYPSLEGRPVFITGGATGIGESLVTHFCQQGAKVAFVDIAAHAGRDLAERLAADTRNRPLFIEYDLTDADGIAALVGDIARRLGGLQVLVNNAANDDRHAIESVTPQYWDERFAVNLRHQFFAAQAAIPHLKAAGGGSIVNFGSISWKTRTGGMPAYTAAKAAVNGLTRGLARDLGKYNIRVNTVVPGWVMTRRQIELWLDEEGKRTLEREQCLRGDLLAADIARMVLFLAADDSRMCTCQEFTVDAGWA